MQRLEKEEKNIINNVFNAGRVAKGEELTQKQAENIDLWNEKRNKRHELKEKLQQEVNVKTEQKQRESEEKQKLSSSPINYDQALGLMRQNLTNATRLLEDVQIKMDRIDVNMPVDTSQVSLLVNNKTRLETIIQEERVNINTLLAATRDIRTSNELKLKRDELERTQGDHDGMSGHNIIP